MLQPKFIDYFNLALWHITDALQHYAAVYEFAARTLITKKKCW